ncbi:MAG: cardiolipin synthase, partial [Lachnospiraceae bacterium]|nr:cardiolipin synthase [Lachnospiraceae bacterium]
GIVGTINMDYRSFYLHYECGAFIIDPKVMLTIKEDILTTLGKCKQITYEEWQKRPLKNKLIQPILMLFSPLM